MAEAVAAAPGLRLAGAMTHFATADEDDDFVREQLAAFTPWARALAAAHPGLLVHAANSAATLREPAAHFDMVRCGIAIYGMDPFHRDPAAHGLEPALELRSYVAEVKRCAPGRERRLRAALRRRARDVAGDDPDRLRRRRAPRADDNADVLVGGRRVPLVGTVSMDNVTVDLGPGDAEPVPRGTEAVLIGGGHPRRGGRRPARHDQLRGHLRDHRPRAARAPPRRGARR